MSDDRNTEATKPVKTLRRVAGTGLLAVGGAFWVAYGPVGLICYVGGLFNCMGVFLVVMLLALPTLVAAPFFLFEAIYAAVIWRRATLSRQRALILRIVLAGGLGCPFMLGLIGLSPTPFDIYVRGFARYAQRRVDVGAIREWLVTLDPNDYRDSGGIWIERQLMEPEQPAVIACLHPKWAQPMFDEKGRLAVRLLWGGGLIGH